MRSASRISDELPLDQRGGREGGGKTHKSDGLSFQREVIDAFVELIHTLGLPKSFGEIYGLLYSSPFPLCFAEIQDALSLSKGSVSQGLRLLKDTGAVRVAGRTTDRREYYTPEIELRKFLAALITERLEPQLRQSIERMERLDAALAQSDYDEKSRGILEGRLSKLAKWRKKAAGILPWIKKILG